MSVKREGHTERHSHGITVGFSKKNTVGVPVEETWKNHIY